MSAMSRLAKEMFYIKEDRNGELHRIGVVTVIEDEYGHYHRGIAILPIGEIFNKEYMVELSQKRALKAMGTKKDDLAILGEAHFRVSKKGHASVKRFEDACVEMKVNFPKRGKAGLVYKSGYKVELSDFELSIFESSRDEEMAPFKKLIKGLKEQGIDILA